MRIDTANHSMESDQPTPALFVDEPGTLRIISIEPDDDIERVLMALPQPPEPIIFLLPEQSQIFHDPSHFAQLRQVYPPSDVSFVLPPSRSEPVARSAHHYGFFVAPSLEQATQWFALRPDEKAAIVQEVKASFTNQQANGHPGPNDGIAQDAYGDVHEQGMGGPQALSSDASIQPETRLSADTPPTPRWSVQKYYNTRHIGLVASIIILLVVAGVVLLPALFSQPSKLISASAITSVGTVAFTSSGQLDPSSAKGLNDTITLSLSHLSTPATGQSYVAWLMPDQSDDSTRPLFLGMLLPTGGKTQLTYVHPDHDNLLAHYSGFEIAIQNDDRLSMLPPLDAKAVLYRSAIPGIPTPGDEQHFSLLDHMRHLLAKDPTLEKIGLQGGLNVWLYRNSEKILEWSSAARDSWPGGLQTDLIHRHIIRILEYLDGTAYAFPSGDIPPGSPLLVDPHAGRIGLLEASPTQLLPAYLTHVDIHLRGLIQAPGHTQAQQQLAIKIDTALKQDTVLFQKVHQDAVALVHMDAPHLQSNAALALLNDMVINANTAYTGQFDATTGSTSNGIVWIHDELQGVATLPITTPTVENT
ncbi:MAG: hypothetical protein NVSMB27_35100 [Ktedonobacteraceae bacterium]